MVKRFVQETLNYLRKNPHILLLALILALGTFFRTYKLIEWFEFAHDGDLYSWIVKDIVVDRHLRLIGQLTTAPGIFIGPAFYYLLIPFFLLTKMDPVGAVIPIAIIGIATVTSYYWVFARLFAKEVGLIASFLYAVLLSPIIFDRRVVPSTPTNIWLVWYFYCLLMIARGNYQVLPILGFLIGLIWHIHIALLPALVAVPLAMLISRKLPSLRTTIAAVVSFAIPSIPLFLFELRHGFSQTQSFIAGFQIDHGGGVGLEKLYLVITKVTQNIIRLFFYPQTLPHVNHTFFVILILLSAIFLVKKHLLSYKEVALFYLWVGLIILYYSVSSTIISEYYFANIEIIFLAILTLFLAYLYKVSFGARVLVLGLLALILIKNAVFFVSNEPYKKGYLERKAVADYIAVDARKNGFPCVGISYITAIGENVGFRYFFWLQNLHTNHPQQYTPNYTIVLPDELAEGATEIRFGHISVIPPESTPTEEQMKVSCSGENTNVTDSMFGFTN